MLNNDIYPNELILIEFIRRYNPIKTKSIHNLYTVLEKKKNPDINFCMKTFTYKILHIEHYLQEASKLLKVKGSKECLKRIDEDLKSIKEYKHNIQEVL